MHAPLHAVTNYVSITGGHDWPFTNWVDAATNIQAAVDASGSGGTVLVSNGTYVVSSEILVSNAVEVVGVSGAERTTVATCYPLS